MGKGRLAGTPIIVDDFRYQAPKSEHAIQFAYFLTHFHADHYAGLKPTWNDGPIYCTHVTARLVQNKFGLSDGILQPLELDTPHRIALDAAGEYQVTVVFIDANHCPGAVMILFQGYFGTFLHTGDFRAHPRMKMHPALKLVCGLGVGPASGDAASMASLPDCPASLLREVAEIIEKTCADVVDPSQALISGIEDQIPVSQDSKQAAKILRAATMDTPHEPISYVATSSLGSQLTNDTTEHIAADDDYRGVSTVAHDPSIADAACSLFSAHLKAGTGIDRLYLDNSFCHPAFDFPHPSKGVAAAKQIIQENSDAIVVIAIDGVGKEEFLLDVAHACGEKVHIPARRMAVVALSGNDRLLAALDSGTFTPHRLDARIRVMSKHEVTLNMIQKWNANSQLNRQKWQEGVEAKVVQVVDPDVEADSQASQPECINLDIAVSKSEWDQCAPVIAIFPSGWSCIQPKLPSSPVYTVPYSLHSSFYELADFVYATKPRNVIPTSDVRTAAVTRMQTIFKHFGETSRPTCASAAMPPELVSGATAAKQHWRRTFASLHLQTGGSTAGSALMRAHSWSANLSALSTRNHKTDDSAVCKIQRTIHAMPAVTATRNVKPKTSRLTFPRKQVPADRIILTDDVNTTLGISEAISVANALKPTSLEDAQLLGGLFHHADAAAVTAGASNLEAGESKLLSPLRESTMEVQDTLTGKRSRVSAEQDLLQVASESKRICPLSAHAGEPVASPTLHLNRSVSMPVRATMSSILTCSEDS